MQKLDAAEKMVQRDLGAPLCPQQIRDERHTLSTIIYTHQRPISYLGVRVETYIDALAVVYTNVLPTGYPLPPFKDCTGDNWLAYVELLDSELPAGVDPEHIFFRYPETYCDNCGQVLQEPCYRRVFSIDDDEYMNVWMWSKCQMLQPDIDSAWINEDPPTSFLSEVDAYYYTIDASQAVVLPAGCGCSVNDGSVTVEISDPYAGEICVTGDCNFGGSHFYLNYGTAFGPSGKTEIDTDLVEAVVLLALTLTGHRSLCGCADFDKVVEYWTEIDPDTRVPTILPAMIRYGGTRAGMQAMRIIDGIMKRPHFNEQAQTAGLIAAGRMRGLPNRR